MLDRLRNSAAPAGSWTRNVRVAVTLALISGAAASSALAVVPTGFTDELVAGSLTQPCGMAFLPDGRIVFTEQNTRWVKIINNAGTVGNVLNIADVRTTGNERGLLGVAVDPNWPARPYLYFYFDHTSGTIYIRMYEVTGDLTDPASTAISLINPYNIITDIPDAASNHNGGTVRFGPDGMLYASMGDDASFCQAQDRTILAGQIIRLDISALPQPGAGPPAKSLITPADNPWAGSLNANERLVYAYGLRNPFRFNVDPWTGTLYIADVGQNTWEEMDECFGGECFGWPEREGAHSYAPGACPGAIAGIDPIYEYNRVGFTASIISGPRYRPVVGGADGFPAEYYGDVFLCEYYQGWWRRLKYNAQLGTWNLAPAVPGQPSSQNWAASITNVSDILEGPDGAIYYVRQFPGEIRRIKGTPTTSVGAELPAGRGIALTLTPNPVNVDGALSVRFTMPQEGHVKAGVYSVTGERIATLFNGRRAAGSHDLRWDGRGADGAAPAGVYFVRLETDGGTVSEKFTLLR